MYVTLDRTPSLLSLDASLFRGQHPAHREVFVKEGPVIPKKCPECGSKDLVPIFYGFESREIRTRIRNGNLAFGALAPYPGMPTHKCRACQATFEIHKWKYTTTAIRLTKLAFGLTLLGLAGYLVGHSTIISDALIRSVMAQFVAGSFVASTLTKPLVLWLVGILLVAVFEAICITRKITLLGRIGGAYVLGYSLSALTMSAWWTMVVEAVSFIFVLIADAALAE